MERCWFPARVFIFFVDKIIEVFFPIFTLIGRVTNYFSRQEKGINCKNKGTNNNNKKEKNLIIDLLISWLLVLLLVVISESYILLYLNVRPEKYQKNHSSLLLNLFFSHQNMATLRNKRKLATIA